MRKLQVIPRVPGNLCPRVAVECEQALIFTQNFVLCRTVQRFFVKSSNTGGNYCETKFKVQEQSQLRMVEHNIRTDFNAMNVAELKKYQQE